MLDKDGLLSFHGHQRQQCNISLKRREKKAKIAARAIFRRLLHNKSYRHLLIEVQD